MPSIVQRMDIIDAWAQQPNERWIGHSMFESLRRWVPDSASSSTLGVEALLRDMDAAGVGHSMLSAWWAPEGPLIDNDEVGQLCIDHPDRFSALVSLDLERPMDALRELRRCVDEYPVKGVRILPWLWGLPPTDRRYYPIYAACCDLELTFCTQIGHAGPQRPSEPGRPIPYLDQVLHEFPDLHVVGGHIGVPWLEEAISLAIKYPKFFIDTSAYATHRYPARLVEYLKSNGSRKVLFGSNHPFWPASDCLAQLADLDLDDAVAGRFLADNARTAFRLET